MGTRVVVGITRMEWKVGCVRGHYKNRVGSGRRGALHAGVPKFNLNSS